jgi:hypothetical protein
MAADGPELIHTKSFSFVGFELRFIADLPQSYAVAFRRQGEDINLKKRIDFKKTKPAQ